MILKMAIETKPGSEHTKNLQRSLSERTLKCLLSRLAFDHGAHDTVSSKLLGRRLHHQQAVLGWPAASHAQSF